jgi:tRNA A37 N6-isopentenylltransferase MiaA
LIEDFRLNIPPDNKAAIEEKYAGERDQLLHELLSVVDPKMGSYLHSKDRRRVINALFKYFKYIGKGIKESDV